jgi:ribosome-associated protein
MENTNQKLQGKEKALRIVQAVLDRQAAEPVVLDVREVSTLCDYFVICAGETGRQVQAIADGLRRTPGVDVGHIEADENGDWVMADCHDVIVHAFTKGTRLRYGLEDLWKKAKQIYPLEKKIKAVDKKVKATLKKVVRKVVAKKKIVKKVVKKSVRVVKKKNKK